MIDLSSIDVSAFPHWLSPGGEVLLINADCMDVLPLLPKVDAIVTDPPYGVGFDYASYDDDPNKHAERCTRWVEAFKLATAGPICVFCGIRQIWMWPQSHWILSWRKTFSVSASPFGSNNWEPVLVYQKGRRGERASDSFEATFIHDPVAAEHPCPKPIKAMQEVIKICSVFGETILDPFAGSFTTAVACIRTQRQCIAIEIDPKYYAIGKRRCEDALAVGTLFDPAALAAPNLFEETQ